MKNNKYGVYYINLDKRNDRKKLIEQELDKLFPKYNRIPAIDGSLHTNNKKIMGAVGCALSHINALERGIEYDANFIFVFEDDFQTEISPIDARKILNNIKRKKFNLILLSYHLPMVKLTNLQNNNLSDIENAQTTCAYVVKKSFAKTLIKLYKESLKKLLEGGDPNKYAIDQYWKSIQKPENKVYGVIPRLGKQRNDYSDIEKCNVNYGGTCFMGILSCKKYKERRDRQILNNSVFQYKYFIGDDSLNHPFERDDIVYLPCGDNYEDLPKKTKLMIKWIVDRYPHVDYIFKTDDDIKINFENLSSLYSTILLKKYDYCGNITGGKETESTYHFGKCKDKSLEVKIKTPPVKYCSGGGYFISNKSALILLKDIDNYKNIYEDMSVGYTLNKNNIYPSEINIKDYSCFW